MKARLALALGAAGAASWLVARRRQEALPAAERPRLSPLARLLDPFRDVPGDDVVVPSLPPGEVIAVPGRGEMFVRRCGSGPGVPLVLLHGWMASADLNWFRLYDRLGERHPVVAPDHRGHGRGIRAGRRFSLEDCADDVAALLRHLGLAPAVAVGYSMGGPIASLLWQRHPDVVSGLVLEATSLEWRTDRQERAWWAMMGPVAVLLRWQAGRYSLLRLMGGSPEEAPPDLVPLRGWLEGEFRRGDATDLADAGRALGRYDFRPFASQVDVPTAVVVTTRDRLVAPHRQLEMARALGAPVFEFEGDHDSAVLQADGFAKVTLDAIAAVIGTRPEG